MTAQALDTSKVTVHEDNSVTCDGREGVNVYAFLALRGSVIARIRTEGRMSMFRRQEARMAQNYGWSARKTWSPKLLDDLNAIGDAAGIARAKNDPTA